GALGQLEPAVAHVDIGHDPPHRHGVGIIRTRTLRRAQQGFGQCPERGGVEHVIFVACMRAARNPCAPQKATGGPNTDPLPASPYRICWPFTTAGPPSLNSMCEGRLSRAVPCLVSIASIMRTPCC